MTRSDCFVLRSSVQKLEHPKIRRSSASPEMGSSRSPLGNDRTERGRAPSRYQRYRRPHRGIVPTARVDTGVELHHRQRDSDGENDCSATATDRISRRTLCLSHRPRIRLRTCFIDSAHRTTWPSAQQPRKLRENSRDSLTKAQRV